MRFAAAAGAVAVSRLGAVPSLPTRHEALALLGEAWGYTAVEGTPSDTRLNKGTGSDPTAQFRDPHGGTCSDPTAGICTDSGTASGSCSSDRDSSKAAPPAGCSCKQPKLSAGSSSSDKNKSTCPLLFASRLNSMKSRRDLVGSQHSLATHNNVLGWIARQGQIKGLDVVYFNYPEHFEGVEAKQVLMECILLRCIWKRHTIYIVDGIYIIS